MSGLHFFPGPKYGILLQSEIFTRYTGEAHFFLVKSDSFAQSFDVIVAKTVDADLISYLRVQFWNRHRVTVDPGREQFVVCWKVDAHVAWVAYRWEGHNHVDLLGAGIAQRPYDVLAARSPYYAVVDDDDVLPVHHGSDGYDLSNYLFPALIRGFYEAPEASLPPIPVFHQSLFHRYPALLRVSEGGWSGGVGDGYHYVCFEPILPSEHSTQLPPGLVHVMVVDLAAWVREVCVFKCAVMVWRFCKLCNCHAVLVETYEFSGLNVSDKICMKCCQCTAL